MAARLASTFFDLANEHDGLFTASEASLVGISHDALAMANRRKTISRLSRGIYRLNAYPVDEVRAQLWEAILLPTAGRRDTAEIGVLSHITALAVYCPKIFYTPSKIDITVTPTLRLRRKLPKWIVIHRARLAEHDVVQESGMPITSLTKTFWDCIESSIDKRLVRDALDQIIANKNAAITKTQLRQLRKSVT